MAESHTTNESARSQTADDAWMKYYTDENVENSVDHGGEIGAIWKAFAAGYAAGRKSKQMTNPNFPFGGGETL